MATPTLSGFVNAADIVISSTTLGSAAAFASASLTNGQFAVAECCIYASFPANHGGLVLNWLIPARLDTGAWAIAKIRDDWMVADVNSDTSSRRIIAGAPNDPVHSDSAVIIAPGADAALLRIRGSCLFKAGAGGGVINLQGAKAGSGASVTILANSQTEYRVY